MGAGQILRDVVNATVPEPLEEISNALVDSVFQFDSITHNRLYVPPAHPVLSFDIFTPFMMTKDVAIEVTVQAEGLADYTETIDLNTGFFNTQTYSICVPEQFRSRMATLTFKHAQLEGSTFISYSPEDVIPGVKTSKLRTGCAGAT